MNRTLQIRNVPEALHRTLKSRAALEGLSLSDYLLREVRKSAERPTMSELRARIESREPVKGDIPPARAIRVERERR
ncbi:MAG: FitA-like ribbon-helix-helix domain-containing protein [Thermoanaerobaculia bacterium]